VPPNLTGDLHLGHGLMLAMQDCLARHRRARGDAVTFIPGFDHAGIGMYATVVHQPDFLPELPMRLRLRRWAASVRRRQRRQIRAMDMSCDWEREEYTLSPGYRAVVRVAFQRLAAEGLVYRAFRDVNWCPTCATTISDMETTPAVAPDGREFAVCGRCDAELARRTTWQWFLRMGPLAEPVLRAFDSGEVRLLPASTAREAAEWLREPEDWCVSRQIPWGHRIPAWRCDTCAAWATRRGRCAACGTAMAAETDVLDTWFSSSLWFLATAGWPGELDPAVHPVSLITTGRDILFFWVLRLLALSRRLAGWFPSDVCYLHGLVLDADGQKMSKSRGNVVSLPDACREHGADVLRAALLAGCREGQDMRLTPGLLRRQARARELLAAVAALPRTDGPGDALDAWLGWCVERSAAAFSAALDRLEFAAAVEALDEVAERALARYAAVRRADGATPGWLLARLAALYEPVMPGVARAAAAGGVAPGFAAAPAVDAWMDVIGELTQLRGPVGLSTATEIRAVLPEAVAAALAGQPWVVHSTPLRVALAGPDDGMVGWRVPLGESWAELHFAAAHAERLRAEAMRRLRAERERLRGLRRRRPASGPVPPALAGQLERSEARAELHRLNAEAAGAAPAAGSGATL
jgi:methionyl-tRNA synthetase